jgi:hypothetical protein
MELETEVKALQVNYISLLAYRHVSVVCPISFLCIYGFCFNSSSVTLDFCPFLLGNMYAGRSGYQLS